MGPSLSDRRFIYGAAPPNIFLSIYQGRPNGMPTWGEMLPESTIWELVSYVQSIGHPSGPNFRPNDLAFAPVAEDPANAGGIPADRQSLGVY